MWPSRSRSQRRSITGLRHWCSWSWSINENNHTPFHRTFRCPSLDTELTVACWLSCKCGEYGERGAVGVTGIRACCALTSCAGWWVAEGKCSAGSQWANWRTKSLGRMAIQPNSQHNENHKVLGTNCKESKANRLLATIGKDLLPCGGTAAAENTVFCCQNVASVWDVDAMIRRAVAYGGRAGCQTRLL